MKRILMILVLALATVVQAQNGFDFSLVGGVNMGQIDGDNADRYRHLGFRAGVGTSYPIGGDAKSQWRWVVELAYTQKGSYIEAYDRKLSADYIEIPLMIAYTTHSKVLRVSVGVAPAVLVRSEVTDGGAESVADRDLFKTFDLLPLTVSVRWLMGTNFGIEGRYQNSMLSVTNETASGTYRLFRDNKGCFHNMLSAGIFLQF